MVPFTPRAVGLAERFTAQFGDRMLRPIWSGAARVARFVDRIIGGWMGEREVSRAVERAGVMTVAEPWYATPGAERKTRLRRVVAARHDSARTSPARVPL